MDKAFKIIKYIVALLPSFVTLTMIVVGILVLPISLIPSLNIVATEIIYALLLAIYGIRVFKTRVNEFYKWSYCIIGILTVLLFFFWSKKIFLIQPFQVLIYALLCETGLQNLRRYIVKNLGVLSWFNFYDTIFNSIIIFIGTNQYNILDNISNSIFNVLKSLNLSTSYIETVVIVLFSLCWLLLVPIIRAFFGIYFFRKRNHINLPTNHVLWWTYFLGYFWSIVSITSYLNVYFSIYEANHSIVFILLIYAFNLSVSGLFWFPVYNSLKKLGQNRDELISNIILSLFILILLVLIDQVESHIIGILTWFLPVLIPNFVGEIYKISDKYQRGNVVNPSKRLEKHLYWLTMVSFNTLLIFNVISVISMTDSGEHKFKQVLISILSSAFKSDTSSNFILSVFSSFIIVLFSLFLAWWLSKGIVKLLKNIYLSDSKGYFE
ncbi:TPA: hypothetical protein ACGO7A_001989 [Streptococcus suis]